MHAFAPGGIHARWDTQGRGRRFREVVLKVLAMPDVQGKLTGMGFELADTANEDFPRIVSEELKQWAKVVKATHIKIE